MHPGFLRLASEKREVLMRNLLAVTAVVCFFILFLPACAEQPQPEPESAPAPEASSEGEKIPVTTSSEEARELYQKGIEALERAAFSEGREALNGAIEKDPHFFMAYYQHAMPDLYFGNMDRFREYAQKAVAVDVPLSPGEELLKNALAKLLEDPKSDVTELGQKLVEMYPKDVEAYNDLSFFQYIVKNYEGAIATLNNALPIAEDPAPIYNMLAYQHMALEQWDEAKAALDKYVELKPDWANPYDSLGDYYMNVEDYEKAYENFEKAFELGMTGSEAKAQKAKEMMAKKPPTI
jgi:tetratricopeptide (TPR) repeat protein